MKARAADSSRRPRAHSLRGPWRLALITSVLVVASCGAGEERSVAAFCSTMSSEKDRILANMEDTMDAGRASGDEGLAVLAGLVASIQGLGELETYLAKLAKVAPEEIATEVELVRDHFANQRESMRDALSDPLGALASGFVDGVMISGPLNTVDEWAVENCGENL